MVYVQVRISRQCKRTSDESNGTFKWKSLRTIRNGNFNNLMSREMQMWNKESKEGIGKYMKNPLKGIKKPRVSRGKNVPHS